MSGWNKNYAIKWKIMLIVKNMLGQEALYSTHSPKNEYYSQFDFFVLMHIIVIVMVVIS